jgi:uncharacterized protein YqgC (DUF456 family)
METVTQISVYIGLFFFFAVMIVAVFAVVFGLPGNWIVFAEAVLYAVITRFHGPIEWWVLGVLLAMALLAEIFEFLVTVYGAHKFGQAGKAAIAGALAGGIAGAILMAGFPPVIGAVIGAFAGVFLGATLVTYLQEKDFGKAWRAGLGAFMGRLGAVLTKGTVTVAMAGIIVARVLF